MYGQRSQLVTAEYWRWWVVHLWVEGFFEVFATVVIAFLFTRLKLLVDSSHAGGVVLNLNLPLRRHHRDLPSPVLHRNAGRGFGIGRGLQRPGGCAAGAGWLRSLGEYPPHSSQRGRAVARRLQVAGLLFRCGCLLEPGGSRACSDSSSTRPSHCTTCRG